MTLMMGLSDVVVVLQLLGNLVVTVLHILIMRILVLRSCFGTECTAGNVQTVLVADGFYEFLRPACVKLFFTSAFEVRMGLVSTSSVIRSLHCLSQKGR